MVYPLLALLLPLSLISFETSFNGKDNDTYVLAQIVEGNLDREEACFFNSFKTAYAHIPLESLGITNLDSFLKAAFEDEPVDFANKDKDMKAFHVFDKNKNIVGYASFDKVGPSKWYVRQLAIDPSHQKNGLGKHLVFAITHIEQNIQELELATRRINKNAVDFYINGLGFKEMEQTPHGLNPERYVGLVKHLN